MINTREVTKIGIVAALYVVLCFVLQPISFGVIQVRLAEMLYLLILKNKRYVYSLTIGCLIANLASALGIVDIIFGTLSTFAVSMIIVYIKKKNLSIWLIPFVAGIMCGLVVGAELHLILGMPLIPSIISVAIGEFIAVTIGVVLYKQKSIQSALNRVAQ